jgi:hypothetical protein
MKHVPHCLLCFAKSLTRQRSPATPSLSLVSSSFSLLSTVLPMVLQHTRTLYLILCLDALLLLSKVSFATHVIGFLYLLVLLASSPAYYTAALTALYESVAGLIDQHQPIVEKYYSSGNMHTVVARLLRECDRVVTGLYDGWEEERDIPRKVSLHNSYQDLFSLCSTS